MSKSLAIAIALVGIVGAGYFFLSSSSSAPTVADVAPKLEAFLEEKSNCQGEFTVDHLSDISIGEYIDRYGGWQVFASHKTTCKSTRSGGSYPIRSTQTYDGLDDPSQNVSVGFVRKVRGDYELFTPDIFKLR